MIVDGKELDIVLNGKTYHCALDLTIEYIGGKWKLVVLWYLRKEKKRFSELKRLIPSISEKMLSIQLRQLENMNLIEKKIYAEVPPRVEYSLTEEGRTLLPALEILAKWGRDKASQDGSFVEVKRKKVPGATSKKL